MATYNYDDTLVIHYSEKVTKVVATTIINGLPLTIKTHDQPWNLKSMLHLTPYHKFCC